MKKSLLRRILALAMTAAMLAGLAIPAGATGASNAPSVMIEQVDNSAVTATLPGREPVELPENENTYAASDVVRVSIVLESESTIEAGFSTEDIAHNDGAIAYRENLQAEQESVMAAIESEALGNEPLNVIWNLTLAANIISAEVAYGDIEAIAAVDGVKEVVIETRYEPMVVAGNGEADPNMATSGKQIGSAAAWAAGYTGAGSRIAIIDTGVDYLHEAFDADAFEYSLGDAMSSLDLLDSDEIAGILDQLNAYERDNSVDAESLYFNTKIPFGYNYIDGDYDISHVNDEQGEHGSHVSGIATANKYVSVDGSFEAALESTMVQGVAPDAQLITMKVFGKDGGAYDSDYMAAIEDAVILGCDAVNLSLGSGNPGMSRSSEAEYQSILDSLAKSGVVTAMSAGNSGYWVENAENGIPYLFGDDVSMQTNGSPGSFTNSLSVASVDNDGWTAASYLQVGDEIVAYNETTGYTNEPMTTLNGEQEYVFLNNIGEPAQWDALGIDLTGKIALCYRGTTSFFEKANAAAERGAIGVIIVNNQSGIINMDLTGYEYPAPCVSILQEAGEYFKANGTAVTGNGVDGWTGTVTVCAEGANGQYNSEYYTMSSFSSWGVPGSLELKPEITAPGGNIYAVAGANVTDDQLLFGDHASYETMSGTSMASPQVAGMAAVVAQYIRENDLTTKTGLDARTLAQSLLMSTAVPMRDAASDGCYYPVIQQGAGLANVGAAVSADSYILMDADATASYEDGKVKVELGDDPSKDGVYSFSFTINNLTDEAKEFALSADVFTQSLFAYSGMILLDTWTTDLAPAISWSVDGAPLASASDLNDMDFNGDNYVNDADGQALLDYATGVRSELNDAWNADLDLDGDVDSNDAYLFLSLLDEGSVAVPANGSVEVTATITLTDSDKSWLANYENGAYIQAYVYAAAKSTAEGVAGTVHSIPVLGFYGDWSDPSMFDKGSYIEYASGMETRPPYLYGTNAAKGNYNSFLVQYNDANGLYHYAGNPFVAEDYMPERNSFSGVNGDKIAKIGFTAIRNAAASAFYVRNAETGEYYEFDDLGAVDSAYYYVNGQTWRNTYYTLTENYAPRNIAEGTEIEIGLVLIPEYYTMNGGVDPDDLGDGAFFSVTTTVDNTAPALAEENGIVIDTDANTMTITASDNRYIAFVGLFDGTGRNLLADAGSKADAAEGEEVVYTLDISDVNGGVFLLQIADYANNISTYKIQQVIGEVVETVDSVTVEPETITLLKGNTALLTAIVLPSNTRDNTVTWTSSDESIVSVDEDGKITANAAGTATITATSNSDNTKSGTCAVTVLGVDYTLDGVLQDEDGASMTFTWNLDTANTWSKVADTSEALSIGSAAGNGDGIDYVMGYSNFVTYAINHSTGAIEATGAACAIPYWDMAVSTVFGGANGGDLVHGIYAGYLFVAQDALAATAYGYNLGSALAQYTGASYFLAVESAGLYYDSEEACYAELIYALDDAGYIWILELTEYGDLYLFNFYPTNLSLDPQMGDFIYYSLSEAPDGSAMFLSTFDGNTNNITMLIPVIEGRYIAGYEAFEVGNVGDGVWPALITSVAVNSSGTNGTNAVEFAASPELRVVETVEVEAIPVTFGAEAVSGGLNAIKKSDVEFADETLLTVELTAVDSNGDEVASTNGVQTVTYDADVMKLVSVTVNGDYRSINRYNDMGKVTVGYVDMDGIPAGATTATLVFEIIDPENTEITVEHEEVNADDAGFEETLELSAVELTEAPEAPVVRPSNPVKPGGSDKPADTDEPDESELPFTDVEESDSFYESVKYVFENGLMNGVGEDTFAPDSDLTRAMVVTVLYRLENKPAVDFAGIFSDVAAGKWYSEAVEWAAANGIVNGYGEGVFGPEDAVTRQQLAAILFRYAQFKGIEAITLAELVAGFADSSDVAEYAISAMNWALSKGIIAETAVGTLAPKANATRAEVAVALHMFMENVLG